MEREALKLALEALENSVDLVVEDAYNAEQLYGNYPTRQGKVGGLKVLAEQHKQAITAINKALAQPAQEPVAIVHIKDDCLVGSHRDNSKPFPDGQYGLWPIGTTPPQRTWVDLPHEDILDLFDEHNVYGSKWLEFARAVLAKSKEKNNG